MIHQSIRTLFLPSDGPSHCPSVNSSIHPSEQLIRNLGKKPLEHNTDCSAIVIIVIDSNKIKLICDYLILYRLWWINAMQKIIKDIQECINGNTKAYI